ncbi:MAG: hypothetical protein GX039_02990 [Clostridia bacterium]|nr:hypothetical protein [Clostridia bacterium]
MSSLFILLQPQLEQVSQCLNEETNKRKRRRMLEGFSWPSLSFLERNLLPSLVLLSSRSQGHLFPKAVYLAAVLQFIFLATLTHNDVEQQIGPRILIGDYFYACFFNLLCRGKILEFMEPLSNLICDIHLDVVRKLDCNPEETADKTYPNSFKEREYLAVAATVLGSRLGQTNSREALLWEEIGRCIGKLWSGKPEGVKTLRVLEKLAPGPTRDMLGELVSHLSVTSPLRRVIAL